jgi:hypothetical protein
MRSGPFLGKQIWLKVESMLGWKPISQFGKYEIWGDCNDMVKQAKMDIFLHPISEH